MTEIIGYIFTKVSATTGELRTDVSEVFPSPLLASKAMCDDVDETIDVKDRFSTEWDDSPDISSPPKWAEHHHPADKSYTRWDTYQLRGTPSPMDSAALDRSVVETWAEEQAVWDGHMRRIEKEEQQLELPLNPPQLVPVMAEDGDIYSVPFAALGVSLEEWCASIIGEALHPTIIAACRLEENNEKV